MNRLKFFWVAVLLMIGTLALFSCGVRREGALSFAAIDLTYAVESVVVKLSQTAEDLPTQTQGPTATATFFLPAPALVTRTPLPPQSLTPTSTSTPPPCDLAAFVLDVTVPADASFFPGDAFTKTWRLRNIGSCDWRETYSLVFVEGDQLSVVASVPLPGRVIPLQEVDVSVRMTAPKELGRYRGAWELRNANGMLFGQSNGQPFYVNIQVISPQPNALVYDFANNYCLADWSSSASGINRLPCPGERTDTRGYVYSWDGVQLEASYNSGLIVIETHPTWQSHPLWDLDQNGGWIQGIFPPVSIPAGAHFKTRIGCLKEATTCDVNFSVQILIPGLPWEELGNWPQIQDGRLQDIDLDLVEYVGLNAQFMLYVDANSNAGLDQAAWVYPRIEK